MIGKECAFSFDDLYRCAYGHEWPQDDKQKFSTLAQPEKNAWVLELAKRSNRIYTETKLGTDGVEYEAFWIDPVTEG